MKLRLTLFTLLAFGVSSTAPASLPALSQTPPAAAQPLKPPTDAVFVEKARAAIQKHVAENRFSGTVLVARHGKPILREGFSLANRELNVAAKPETIFRLGSITKQFTAASIMQLVQQGKLKVEDPVSKYYTAAPAAWSGITVRHLLNHRSGIPSYTGLPGFMTTMATTPRTPEQIVELTRDKPLEFEPGSKYAYNNTGYVLLGHIIEKVSGQTYAEYLDTHIFKPLGMKNSGYDVSAKVLPNRAAGYDATNNVWANAQYLSMTLPHAAGALYSTVDDLLVWEEAFFSDKIVSKASREAMTTDNGNNYGYGLGFGDIGGHRSIAHGGGIHGFSTYMTRFPADGVTIIVLSNLQSAPTSAIGNELARLIFGIPAPPPPAPLVAVAVKPEVLDRYVGEYELQPGFNITMKREGDKLTAQATGQGAFTLTSTSDTEFHFQPANIRVVFPAGAGPAPSFTLFQGPPREAKRITKPATQN
ncbi:MAG TPA: serine hydrolase [Hyphomonadaceae bacterium]